MDGTVETGGGERVSLRAVRKYLRNLLELLLLLLGYSSYLCSSSASSKLSLTSNTPLTASLHH